MSVVPLIIDTEDRTVVENLSEFAMNGHRICIEGLDKNQLQPFPNSLDSNVSYDLRVGTEFRDHREEGKRPLGEGEKLFVHPGSALVIRTKEKVYLPTTMFGIVTPKVTLLQKGVSNTFSKVDPGYHGYLLVTVFNLGKAPVELEHGAPFCGLTVLEVAPGAREYRKGEKEMGVGTVLTPIQRFSDWLEARSGYLHLAEIIATVILIGATILLAISHFLSYSRP